MTSEPRHSFLSALLVVTGIAFIVGLPLLMAFWPTAWTWEPRQSEYEQMIMGVYATLGVFLLLAARHPAEHRSLLAFTAWSSLVHGGIMLVQALVDRTERANLIGDVPFLIVLGILLLVLMPRRGPTIATP